jgi:hypothetical protein
MMGKSNRKKKVEFNMTNNNQAPKIPAGYKEQSTDIVGFWNFKTCAPLHFIPKYVRLSDSNIDPNKSSTLVIGELIENCALEDKDGNEVLGGKGQLVGVWAKPGMKAISNLAGVAVYMYQDGEVDIGKPNPMILFKVMAKTRGAALVIEADYRKSSRNAKMNIPAEDVGSQSDANADAIPFG